MLYRRFAAPGEVHDFLKTYSFTLHTQHLTSAGRETAVKILENQLLKKEEHDPVGLSKKAETLFRDLEPRCGLLKCEKDQYSFRHLTFQEFLTKAQELADREKWFESLLEYEGGKKGLPVLRGGAWDCGHAYCRCAYRDHGLPVVRSDDVGFRCARALLDS